MLTWILISIVVVVLVFIVIVILQPADFRITRSATISAPPATVFAEVNDFHKWQAWSPWAKLDPAATFTYDGAPAGTGAIYSWSGNNKVGEGRMTLTESRPDDLVRINLDFVRPFAASNVAEFTFTPQANQTNVTWSMSGRNKFPAKAFGLFMNIDKMVGGDFEKGLAQLKAVAEADAGR